MYPCIAFTVPLKKLIIAFFNPSESGMPFRKWLSDGWGGEDEAG